MIPDPQPNAKKNSTVIGLVVVAGILVLACGIVGIAYAVYKFADTLPRSDRPEQIHRPAEIVDRLNDGWLRQEIGNMGLEIDLPVRVREEPSEAKGSSYYATYCGWYPNGLIEIFVFDDSSIRTGTKEEVASAVEEWQSQLVGVERLSVRAVDVPGIEPQRRVFEMRFRQDDYEMVTFVEVANVHDVAVWITLRAFKEKESAARLDFQRILASQELVEAGSAGG